MNPKSKPQKPSLTSFPQNPQTVEVCSMICETGANQLIVRCSDCNRIHEPEVTSEAILKEPLKPMMTAPRIVSEVCVRGLYYELALLEKQLEEANKVLATLPMDWCDYLNYTTQTQDQDLLDEMRAIFEELIEVLAPKQSKIVPGQIPTWTTIDDNTEKEETETVPLSSEEAEIIEALTACQSQVQNGLLPLKTLFETVNQNLTINNHFVTLQQVNRLIDELGFQKRTCSRTHQICIILDSERLEELKHKLHPNNNPKTEAADADDDAEA